MRTLKRVANDKPMDLDFRVKLPNVLRKKGVYTTDVTIKCPNGDIYKQQDKINLVVYPPITRRNNARRNKSKVR